MNKIAPEIARDPDHDTPPVHQQVYDALCEAILGGQFVPGVSVTLRGIAEQLGVSPMPVREAIRRLVTEQALEVLSNRRVCVTPMSKTRLEELSHARLALEPELAARAFTQLDKRAVDELHQIDQTLNQSLRSGDVDAYIHCNRRFHFGIYQRARSLVLYPLVHSLWLQFAPFTRIVFGRMGTDLLQDFHAEALEALDKNDAPAFRLAIENDIREGMDMLSEQLRRL